MNRIVKSDQESHYKIISCKEKGKEFIFNCNKEKFYKIKVDCKEINKLLNLNSKKCDYAICSKDLKTIVLYVELKGSDIRRAFEQIQSTHKEFGGDFENIYGGNSLYRYAKSQHNFTK